MEARTELIQYEIIGVSDLLPVEININKQSVRMLSATETNTLILLMTNGTTQGQSKPTAINKLSATVSGARQENQQQNMQQNVPSTTNSTFDTGTTEYGESTTPASALNINIDPRSVLSTSTDASILAIPDQIAATPLEYTNIVTPTVHVPSTEHAEAAPPQPKNNDNIVPQSQVHVHDRPEQESSFTDADLKTTELSPEEIAKIVNNQPSICLTSSVSKPVSDKETPTSVDQYNYIINNQPRVGIECYIPPPDPRNDGTK